MIAKPTTKVDSGVFSHLSGPWTFQKMDSPIEVRTRRRTVRNPFERARDNGTVIQGSRNPGRIAEHNQSAGV